MALIHRVTMFKIPNPENQSKLIEAYKTLGRDQKKVCVIQPTTQASLSHPFPFPQHCWAHTA